MIRLELGDSGEVLKRIDDSSIDSLVCDPPAGISFMGKEWDHDHGHRDEWVKAFAAIFREALRTMKPGAHGLVWALPRTSHWTATALEDAGFEVRDIVMHLFGTGFPKSLDVSKAIDKALDATRSEVLGPATRHGGGDSQIMKGDYNPPRLAPATPEAARFSGWGTALKPAAEHWILVRKPLAGTVAANVLTHGTGALNIDASRIATTESLSGGAYARSGGRTDLPGAERSVTAAGMLAPGKTTGKDFVPPLGRFPANVVLSHHPDCRQVGTKKVKAAGPPVGKAYKANRKKDLRDGYGTGKGMSNTELVYGFGDADGTETVEAWECVDGCAVKMLDAQSGDLGKSAGGRIGKKAQSATANVPVGKYEAGDPGFGDSGGASRFFYVAKASKADKGADNDHPTPKNTKLMEYLIRMITPPGGVVLDCFMGSGSTGVAARALGFRFIGIERDSHYFEIAQRRLGVVPEFDPITAYD